MLQNEPSFDSRLKIFFNFENCKLLQEVLKNFERSRANYALLTLVHQSPIKHTSFTSKSIEILRLLDKKMNL